MSELTKSGKPVSERTFGTLVGRDTACRRAAVDLGLLDPDLRLVGRYLHYYGYNSLVEARELLSRFAREHQDPFVDLAPKTGDIVNLDVWRRSRTRRNGNRGTRFT